MERSVPNPSSVALTYANDRQMDGAGAQLQRIYGVYALSRLWKVPYVHSPLKRIGYQGLHALESNASEQGCESRYNRIFEIASDVEVPGNAVIHDVDWADAGLVEEAAKSEEGGFHLFRILYPYSITDRHPESYECVSAISPFAKKESSCFRVAIHVRRGELFVVDSQRMLPNAYYISCATRVVEVLQELSIPFACELYTEVPSKKFVVTPQHHGIDHRVAEDFTLDPAMNALEDFHALPNLRAFVNADPIETLEGIATADAVIMSRSSYSYVAAILNGNGTVICHPFWHAALPGWVISSGEVDIPAVELVERFTGWRDGRAA